ncbi:MAG: hypothetical protein ACFBSF_13155 [Leptolyngbyaceae cyanobacterium]
MANVVTQLRDRLLQKRPFRMDRMEKDAAYPSEVEESLAELPADIAQQLIQLVRDLPSHPCDQSAILEALHPEIARWQENPNVANNSLTILSSPVAAVARVLAESLEDWATQNALTITLLGWTERPMDPDRIQEKMRAVLEPSDSEGDCRRVVIIPNLNWCFLRSAEGLDGIDYLRDELLSDCNRFWIIGGGQVSWQYLNSILKLQAHCGEVVELPELSGKQLQNWLMPVIEHLNIQLDKSSIQKRLQELSEENSQSFFERLTAQFEEVKNSLKSLFRDVKEEALSLSSTATDSNSKSQWENYFERLSDLSDGVSNVALQLFIKSISYKTTQTPSETKQAATGQDIQKSVEDCTGPKSSSKGHLVAKTPQLPTLPELAQSDLYILFSLLVHGDVTLTALADSLGEERQVINDSIQVLRTMSLVEQQGYIFKINPIHYPRLKRHLASNNFIVDVTE